MLKEHDLVVLTEDLSEEGLGPGDVGTIVHVHRGGEAFEVEFTFVGGDTVAVVTVLATQVRPVNEKDVTHARRWEVPA
jgi:hypothetical protein